MVDEFSAFARMPQPVIKPEDLSAASRGRPSCLQKTRRGLEIDLARRSIPEQRTGCCRVTGGCSRQALTNLLQNAADAVGMREGANPEVSGREGGSISKRWGMHRAVGALSCRMER